MVQLFTEKKSMRVMFFACDMGHILLTIPVTKPLERYFLEICKHFNVERSKQNFVYRDQFLTDSDSLLTICYEGDPIEMIQFR